MSSVGVRELKDHLSGLLRRVRDGETMIITDRGLPIGELGPVANRAIAERARALVHQGLAHWGGGKPKGLRHPPAPQRPDLRRGHRGPGVILYLDTSSLVKMYVEEPGSLQAEVEGSELVTTSIVAYGEARAALARRRREGSLTAAERRRFPMLRRRRGGQRLAHLSREGVGRERL